MPGDFDLEPKELFDPEYMRALFERGVAAGRDENSWIRQGHLRMPSCSRREEKPTIIGRDAAEQGRVTHECSIPGTRSDFTLVWSSPARPSDRSPV